MIDGLWTVEFISAINRYGRGVLVLNNGRLLGGDDGYYYSRKYDITDNNIVCDVDVIKYDANSISIFGNVDQFKLTISGKIDDFQLSAIGSVANNHQSHVRIVGNKKENL